MIIPVIDAIMYMCVERQQPSSCVGLKCMAWRWADVRRVRGYCGNAGEPLVLSLTEPDHE